MRYGNTYCIEITICSAPLVEKPGEDDAEAGSKAVAAAAACVARNTPIGRGVSEEEEGEEDEEEEEEEEAKAAEAEAARSGGVSVARLLKYSSYCTRKE